MPAPSSAGTTTTGPERELPTSVSAASIPVGPWRDGPQVLDAPPGVDGAFFRGLLFALPLSGLMWVGIYALWRWLA